VAKSQPEKCDILIAGGGFVGTALALALADGHTGKGFSVVLADAADPAAPGDTDWRASAITAASRRMLNRLGVWQAIDPRHTHPVSRMTITDGTLDEVARPPILTFDTANGADDGLDAAIIVRNAALLDALYTRARDVPAIRAMAPCRITRFTTGPASVTAETDSGETLQPALLIGADGARSQIRESAGIKTVAWDYGQWGIVAEIELSRSHKGYAVQHFLPHGPFAMLPLPDHRASLVWSEEAGEAKRLLKLDESAFCRELQQRLGHQFGEVSLTGGPQGFPLGFSVARQFVANRLALVGDAAHKVHPLAGQGVNLGFKDVAALTEVLKTARNQGEDYAGLAVLERYQKWRRFDSVSQSLTMDGLNRLFSNDSGALRMMRDVGMGLVDRIPLLKSALIREAAGDTGTTPALMRPGG